MAIQEWNEVISVGFPEDKPVTDDTIKVTKTNARKFRGSVRVAMGKIWKSSDFEAWRTKILQTPLP